MIVEIQVAEAKRSALSTKIGLIPMTLDWDQGTGNLIIKLASPAHDQTALHFCFGIGLNGYQLALNRDRMPWTGYVVKLQNNILPNTIMVEVEPRPTLG